MLAPATRAPQHLSVLLLMLAQHLCHRHQRLENIKICTYLVFLYKIVPPLFEILFPPLLS